MTPAFWDKIIKVTNTIGARRPEDLIMVLSAESAFTMSPSATKSYRRPIIGPPNTWEGTSGALGLNTIMPFVGREIGLTPQQWWSLPDMTPEQNLDITEKYFQHILHKYGQGKKGYANVLDLYLANAALATWIKGVKGQLAPNTIIYGPSDTKSNPGLDYNKDGIIDVGDMNAVILSAVYPNTKKYLNEYANYRLVAGLEVSKPYVLAGYHPEGKYVPDDLNKSLNEINGGRAPNPAGAETPGLLQRFDQANPVVKIGTGAALGYGLYRLARLFI